MLGVGLLKKLAFKNLNLGNYLEFRALSVRFTVFYKMHIIIQAGPNIGKSAMNHGVLSKEKGLFQFI
jgi:hypothetical protein